MKKFALPLLVAMIFGTVALTGCDQTVIAPEDTWCSMEQQIGTFEADLSFYYSKTGTTIQRKNKSDIEIPAGFTVVVSSPIEIGGITGSPFYMYTFKSGETVNMDELGVTKDDSDEGNSQNDNKFTFKATMWDVLYVAKYKTDFMKTEGTEPAIFKYGTSVNTFADLGFENITWRDILITALQML